MIPETEIMNFFSVYVDASDMCNDLGFNLGSTGSTVTRSWTIKITQYDCNYDNLAPDGCTQYFWGQTTDTVQTYNFDSGAHLASQNQNICVRRERGTCQICWATTAEGDFEISTIRLVQLVLLRLRVDAAVTKMMEC